jgi:hypothetical protein
MKRISYILKGVDFEFPLMLADLTKVFHDFHKHSVRAQR